MRATNRVKNVRRPMWKANRTGIKRLCKDLQILERMAVVTIHLIG